LTTKEIISLHEISIKINELIYTTYSDDNFYGYTMWQIKTTKKKHMNIETIRDYCLSKAEAEETLPFGPDVIVYKVNNKAFLLLPLDTEELRFNVKCDPDLAIELREQYSCVLPGWHMNKKHWNTIVVDGTVPSKLIKEWIDHSYELVKAKKTK
jgi:predicted DNA-binding protein (MmcQ/YjbR family)